MQTGFSGDEYEDDNGGSGVLVHVVLGRKRETQISILAQRSITLSLSMQLT